MKQIIKLSILSLAIVVFVGCQAKDRDMRKVVGKVTYNGSPVEEVLVQFVPLDDSGLAASGQSDANGNYTLTTLESKVPGSGTKPARYKVVVSKFEKPPVDPDTAAYEAGEIDYGEYMTKRGQIATPPTKHLLPTKYSKISTTPFEFTVEDKKENQCNLELAD